jgi:hypothetical protein
MKALDEEAKMLSEAFTAERKTVEEQRDAIFTQMTNIVTPSVEAAMNRVIAAWNDKEITATIQNADVNINVTIPGATIAAQASAEQIANKVNEALSQNRLNENRGVDFDPSTSKNKLNRTTVRAR